MESVGNRKPRMGFAHLVTLGLCLQASVALAQPDAGTLLNELQRQQQRLPDRLPEPGLQPARPVPKETTGLKIKLQAVRFTGAADLATEAELQAVMSEAIGREFDFAGLEQLAQRVTEFLRSRGWLLAQVYLPRQDITDGQIDIAIRPGRLDGMTDGLGKAGAPYAIVPVGKLPLRIHEAPLRRMLDRQLPAGATPKEADLERALLLLNDLPGMTARAHLEPGVADGSTRVVVSLEEGPWLSGNASINNHGNRDTGTAQLTATVQGNDPLRIGDQISLGTTHSQGLDLYRLAYSLPVGNQGLWLGAAWTSMDYRIIRGSGLAAGLEGSSTSSGLTLTAPFIRSRASNLYGLLGVTRKSLQDNAATGPLNDKRTTVWNLALSGDLLDRMGGGGFTSWSLGWTSGDLDLSRVASDSAADAAGYNRQGSYDKVGYGLARLQKLTERLNLFTSFSGQRAGKNLDSSEKFILGGPNGVRAYPGSEASGDNGSLLSVELRYDLPGTTPLGQVQLSAFHDAGRITLHHDAKAIPIATLTGRNSYHLAGSGLGINITKAGGHAVRFAWARTSGGNPGASPTGLNVDSRANKSCLWLQVTAWF